MTAQEIKTLLPIEKVLVIMSELGAKEYRLDPHGNYIFQTVCHQGDAFKLYYYEKTQTFHCFTGCGDSFDIFELYQRVNHCSFFEALNGVCRIAGISPNQRQQGFSSSKKLVDDWDVINKYKDMNYERNTPELKVYNKSLIGYFPRLYYQGWLDEGISKEAMDKFNIRFSLSGNRIIIPHLNPTGDLIGIRTRNLDEREVASGHKYMPLFLEGDMYSHPLAYNLYGLYNNQEAIQRMNKVIIFESEKSVLQCEAMFGEDNFAVATCGSTISRWQRETILKLGVKEVFIAFDRQYESNSSEEAMKYASKIMKLAWNFSPYCTTYVIWDSEDNLGYKDSPSDKGKEVLLELMKRKYEVKTNDQKNGAYK